MTDEELNRYAGLPARITNASDLLIEASRECRNAREKAGQAEVWEGRRRDELVRLIHEYESLRALVSREAEPSELAQP